MPAEKRPPESQNDDASSPLHSKQRLHETQASAAADHPSPQRSPHHSLQPPKTEADASDAAAAASGEDSDGSDTGYPQHQEFAYVDLQSIRKEVQCPICLGIIKKTRTVMECLHRFCRECIDKSMRMGNNECPACRTHCASRRSLRDDPRYDAIIAALYPDIRKFEEEELAFGMEDETRNKQIQDSIAQVLQKQSDVLGKKRPSNKEPGGTSMTRPQRNCRNVQSRRRRRRRNASPEFQDSDDNNDTNGIDKHYDPDETHTEIKQRKGRNRASIGSSNSPSSTNLSEGTFDNNLEQRMEARGLSPGLTCSAEMLAWGRGGVRSSSRNNNTKGGMSRSARRIRLDKLIDFLRNLEEDDKETAGMRDCNGSTDHESTLHPSSANNDKASEVVDPSPNRLHLLDANEALSGAVAKCLSNGEQMVLAYQQKEAI